MALSHTAAVCLPAGWAGLIHLRGGVLGERWRAVPLRGGLIPLPRCGCAGRIPKGMPPPPAWFRLFRGSVSGRARLNLAEAPVGAAVEKGQIRTSVEIPVTCYQIIGVSAKAEKDEIVKAAMELKNSDVEDGYTADIIVSRQDLLVDVRDKLLFEPQYAGDIKEKLPPKSSLRIPWAWLPAALCLLQEVGEEKLVLEIGRSALQLADVKPYVHDVLLSMALAECSIAKAGFEKSKVSEGFEALARAQYLLRSKVSLGDMPLLLQIEESLEELAPACTLELLSMPHTPENAERRRGAIAALRELLRQGLDVEASCRVQDWSCFLSQAIDKLLASEIVDLLPWDNLAITRKNKKSLESQNQRVVIDFSCFYMAMISHLALGFTSRRIDLISKAKNICECLIASDGMDIKFEEAFCLLLLGQGGEAVAIEKLRELEVNRSSVLWNSKSNILDKDEKDTGKMNRSLETWLKDVVLCMFSDTRDCSPSLATFFRGPKQTANKQKIVTAKIAPISIRPPSLGLSAENRASGEQLNLNSTRYLGDAVKQLAPANLQSQLIGGKGTGSTSSASVQLKGGVGLCHPKIWESWSVTAEMAGKIAYAILVGCFMIGTFKLLTMRRADTGILHRWHCSHPEEHTDSLAWTKNRARGTQSTCSFADKSLTSRFCELLALLRKQFKQQTDVATLQDTWPNDDLSAPTGTVLHKQQMRQEEAQALVKQWQEIKSEALGPDHQVQILPEILADSMLLKWQDLAKLARSRSCFWKFVLLQLSVLRADIILDETGNEMAEIEAMLEEAAELVDESQPKNPNYYSTYKVKYILRRQDDGSWRFCAGRIENPV